MVNTGDELIDPPVSSNAASWEIPQIKWRFIAGKLSMVHFPANHAWLPEVKEDGHIPSRKDFCWSLLYGDTMALMTIKYPLLSMSHMDPPDNWINPGHQILGKMMRNHDKQSKLEVSISRQSCGSLMESLVMPVDLCSRKCQASTP